MKNYKQNNFSGLPRVLNLMTYLGFCYSVLCHDEAGRYRVQRSKSNMYYVFLTHGVFILLNIASHAYISYYSPICYIQIITYFLELSLYGVIFYIILGPVFKPTVLNKYISIITEIDDITGFKLSRSRESRVLLALCLLLTCIGASYMYDACWLGNVLFQYCDGQDSVKYSQLRIFYVVPRFQLHALQAAFVFLVTQLASRLDALTDIVQESLIANTETSGFGEGVILSDDFIRREFPQASIPDWVLDKQYQRARASSALCTLARVAGLCRTLEAAVSKPLAFLLVYYTQELFWPLTDLFQIKLFTGGGSKVPQSAWFLHLKPILLNSVSIAALTETCHALTQAYERCIVVVSRCLRSDDALWSQLALRASTPPRFTASRTVLIDRPVILQILFLLLSITLISKQIEYDVKKAWMKSHTTTLDTELPYSS